MNRENGKTEKDNARRWATHPIPCTRLKRSSIISVMQLRIITGVVCTRVHGKIN